MTRRRGGVVITYVTATTRNPVIARPYRERRWPPGHNPLPPPPPDGGFGLGAFGITPFGA